jgi:plasmid stability protein
MKNVTIAIDDETYRRARIRAAEMGTSVSAMVKRYLNEATATADAAPADGVREMPMTWTAQPSTVAVADDEPLPPGAYGRFPDGTPYYTPGGKPRQPGAMRGMLGWTEDFDTWPEGFLEGIENGFPGAVKWWLPDEDGTKGDTH